MAQLDVKFNYEPKNISHEISAQVLVSMVAISI